MYVEPDFFTPAIMTNMNDRKFKNRILKYWPTEIVNTDVIVLSKLYLYSGGSVQKTDTHKKIYTLLNMKIKDLEDEEWDGVEKYWLEFTPEPEGYDDISKVDLYNYTLTLMPEIGTTGFSDWATTTITYEPPKTEYDTIGYDGTTYIPPTDAELIAGIISNPFLANYDKSVEGSKLAIMALMDSTRCMFEVEIKVTKRQLVTSYGSSKYVKLANMELKYRRKAATIIESDVLLQRLVTWYTSRTSPLVTSIDSYTMQSRMEIASSGSQQLTSIYTNIVPLADTNIITTVTSTGWGSEEESTLYYKKEGLRELPSKYFKNIIKGLNTDFQKESVDGWMKVVMFVVIVIIIVVSAVLAVPSGGTSTIVGAKAIGAFMGLFSLYLTIGVLAMTGISSYFAKNGEVALAAYIGKSIQVLGTLATAAGIVALIAGITAAIDRIREMAQKEAQRKLVEEITLELVLDTITTGSVEVAEVGIAQVTSMDMLKATVSYIFSTIGMTTAQVIGKYLSWATTAFNAYVKYINPPDEGVSDMKQELEDSQKELEGMGSPDGWDKVSKMFSDPYRNIYDMNEYQQGQYYELVQGKVDRATTKFYS